MRDRRELAYRVYVSECLRIVARVDVRYFDLAYPEEKPPGDERTSDEIIADIRSGLTYRREMENKNGSV